MTPEVETRIETKLWCTVVSLVPFELHEEKPGLIPGRFMIEKSDGKTPSILHVTNSLHYVYLDDTRGSLQVRDPVDEVAASIVRDYVNSQLGINEEAYPGLMWLQGKLSAEQVMKDHAIALTRLKLAQNKWFLQLSRMADDDWQRYHKHTVISDFQRTAAEHIGWKPEEHEWMRAVVMNPVNPTLCYACKSQMHPDALVCPICRAIQNPEKNKDIKFAV